MPVVYSLTAVQCPLPQVPVSVVAPTPGLPAVSSGVTAGLTQRYDIPGLWNQNAWQADYSGRSAGGCFGIVLGLDLTAGSGLTLNIAAGWAFVDGMRWRSATTHACVDGQRNFLWMNQAGGVNHTTPAGPGNGLTPPSGVQVFLGSALCSGGAITQIDGSGVVWVNGVPWRKTADAGQPGDTPPANVRLWTETVGGVYLWTGTRYWQVG